MNTEIIALEQICKISTKMKSAFRKGYAASIAGAEGSGVTMACKYVTSEWSDTNSDRQSLYLTAFPETDAGKLMQYFAMRILKDEMPADWRLHCVSNLIHLMSAKIQSAQVGLIVLDRADLAPDGFIDSILTMCNDCSTPEKPVSLLLGSRLTRQQQEFKIFETFSSTQIAAHAQIHPLNPSEVATILVGRCNCLHLLPELLENNDQVAITAINEIAKLTRGNFRRLDQFASILDELRGPLEFTAESVRQIWASTLGGLKKAA